MSPFQVHPATAEDYSQAGELVAQVFSHGDPHDYEHRLHHWITSRPQSPGFHYLLHRLGVLDGEIVAHLFIKPFLLQYGSARLSVGGIGGVCTHPNHRGRGYMEQVMQDAMIFMAEHSLHLALLDGIDHYYDRFGFSPVWPYYFLTVDSAEAAGLNSPLRLRDARPDDATQIAALYDRHWDGRVTVKRDPATWDWRIRSGYIPVVQVVEDKDGLICGYMAVRGLFSERVEVVTNTPEAARTLLAAAGRAYRDAGIESLRWLVPPDDALVSFARQFMTVTVSAQYRTNGGWMGRLIDARGMIATLLPEIIAQARATDPAFNPDALMVEPGGQGVRIGLRTNSASFCQLSYDDFMQVVFGSLRPGALAVRPNSQLQPEGRMLLELLFPPRMAVLGWWDWF